MKPINYLERNRTIRLFCAIYLASCLLLIYWFFLLFIFVPKEDRRQQEVGKEEQLALLNYTNEADSLVVRIWKQKNLEIRILAPFFKWTNDLKEAFPQPFYQLVVNSYADLIHELAESKQGDSTFEAAKEKFIFLRKEEQDLRKQNDALKMQLSDGKKAKNF